MKTAETTTQNLNRVWMLIEFKDYKKEYFIQKKAFLDLTNSERANAKMGCNNLSFYYKTNKNNITYLQGISTEMLCEDMKLEDSFFKEIPSIKNFKVDGHKLILTSSNGEKMVFIAQDWD
jgi:heat shock protein HslJ